MRLNVSDIVYVYQVTEGKISKATTVVYDCRIDVDDCYVLGYVNDPEISWIVTQDDLANKSDNVNTIYTLEERSIDEITTLFICRLTDAKINATIKESKEIDKTIKQLRKNI